MKSTLWRLGSGIVVLAVFLGGIIWLARPSQTSKVGPTDVSVVAGENFWGNIAAQLGGSRVHVTSIISNSQADPHLYEASAQDASAVAAADIVIVNGAGYDDFMSRLLNVSKNSKQVLTAAQILGVPSNANQHVWYDIHRVSLVASQITKSYIAADPAHKSSYQHNLAVFNQSLQPLLKTISRIKQQFTDSPVAYTEPLPAYLLNDAGLAVKTPTGFAKSIEDGDEPSPADAQAMAALMTSQAVKLLIYNSQATSPATEHIKALAQQAGIPVIGFSETLPVQQTYQQWQQYQLDQLYQALQTR